MSKEANATKVISNPENSKELLTGVLIGGALGVAVGALATILARLFIGLIRKVLHLDDQKFDPRWLLQ
ncbi:MAG: hypothetical protein HXX08_16470 [Chloroflexi bacterium]|uniref:Uncharacterized protein n=1 Tax=Candidatus Chlorohelix allophototropha TaxID=3003348 RepID=A0A8T7M5T1_9CHLR|nr:hypothetical protein [Chloroflexota bacterium]WJW69367.1 hypothetical protein OZ401_002975 [Chloroflexota bacterium L227-S17]